MMTSTIKPIILAAFDDTIKCDIDGDGRIDLSNADYFIECIEEVLAIIKQQRDEYAAKN